MANWRGLWIKELPQKLDIRVEHLLRMPTVLCSVERGSFACFHLSREGFLLSLNFYFQKVQEKNILSCLSLSSQFAFSVHWRDRSNITRGLGPEER